MPTDDRTWGHETRDAVESAIDRAKEHTHKFGRTVSTTRLSGWLTLRITTRPDEPGDTQTSISEEAADAAE